MHLVELLGQMFGPDSVVLPADNKNGQSASGLPPEADEFDVLLGLVQSNDAASDDATTLDNDQSTLLLKVDGKQAKIDLRTLVKK